MTERIYILSYYHHQIGNINYNPLLRVNWVMKQWCALYVSVFLFYWIISVTCEPYCVNENWYLLFQNVYCLLDIWLVPDNSCSIVSISICTHTVQTPRHSNHSYILSMVFYNRFIISTLCVLCLNGHISVLHYVEKLLTILLLNLKGQQVWIQYICKT